jgi:WD40 repeat protein
MLVGKAATSLGLILVLGLCGCSTAVRPSEYSPVIFQAHKYGIRSIAFVPDGTLFATCADREVKIWDARSLALVRTLAQFGPHVGSVAFSQDGKMLACGTCDEAIAHGEVLFLDTNSGNEVHRLRCHTSCVNRLSFSADGKFLATAGNRDAILWELASWKAVLALKAKAPSVIVSPDGTYLAVGTLSKLSLWTTDAGHQAFAYEPSGDISSIAVSPDSQSLATFHATAGYFGHGEIVILDARSGEKRAVFKAHDCQHGAIAFSPDVSTIASVSSRRVSGKESEFAELKLWDTTKHSLKVFVRSSKADDLPDCLAYSPDGNTIVSGSRRGTLSFWRIDELR